MPAPKTAGLDDDDDDDDDDDATDPSSSEPSRRRQMLSRRSQSLPEMSARSDVEASLRGSGPSHQSSSVDSRAGADSPVEVSSSSVAPLPSPRRSSYGPPLG